MSAGERYGYEQDIITPPPLEVFLTQNEAHMVRNLHGNTRRTPRLVLKNQPTDVLFKKPTKSDAVVEARQAILRSVT